MKLKCSYLLVYNLLFKYVIKFVYRIKYTLVAHTHIYIYMYACMYIEKLQSSIVFFLHVLDSSCFVFLTITQLQFLTATRYCFILCRLDLRAISKIFFIHMNVYIFCFNYLVCKIAAIFFFVFFFVNVYVLYMYVCTYVCIYRCT